MAQIHPTAIVEDGARLAEDVRIGPYSVIGAEVELGGGVVIESHVVVGGRTRIGEDCHIFPFASIGLKPQDLKFKGEKSELIIGKGNQIREHVTMNPGTEGGGLVTRVGDHCLFMVGSHIAHDCTIGDHVIMANNATLAGHVSVGDHAIIGGLSAVHQFVRIGHHAMVGGMSGVEQDVIPFGSVTGDRAHLMGLNLVGLKRHGFEREDIHTLRNAYRLLFADEGTLSERLSDVAKVFGANSVVAAIVGFMRSESQRGICQPRDGHAD
ncbi:MAG: acyl-ACP--UDP-N-acetylglucosamine O-acyltransferase [Proteobacteria bacterium]|nr:acyl-ACP--UDP-N-acetylglucosamine O-acyltransferase [Pseudomonadota bacterium]MDA0952794.1 acyl-ACP--UDP-N-acetylglucosamine O-acyltransferase [Pseudomonadota bacterium]MDA1071690.1 acyl-ACP--UDP-N-acetylglucosamine O-acyltransferase [Pseudomonadota bacterium]